MFFFKNSTFHILRILFAVINIVYSLENKFNPTLLISFDGFRSSKLEEFLKGNPSSNLQKYFVENGIKAEYMKPAFPSNTFPNHFSMITGLYPENHGIVNNEFYDAFYQEKINLLRGVNNSQVRWWNNSEPLWVTAKKQGLKTASFFWVGSEIWPQTPDIYIKYNMEIKYKERVDEVLKWFVKFKMDFSTLYFDEPDTTGHAFGPLSDEYKNKINELDQLIGYLISQFQNANLLEKLNIVIVSDHGMASYNSTVFLTDQIKEMIDFNKSVFYESIINIYPKNDSLKETLLSSLNNLSPFMKAYLKEDMPEKYNFKNSLRIAPIVIVMDEGYILRENQNKNSKGSGKHGYDNNLDALRCILLARGPDFKKNIIIKPVNTVDVYPLVCHLLKVNCHKNNGSIENFKDGLHSSTSKRTSINVWIYLFIIIKIVFF